MGDTIRVSLTEDPEAELPVCRDLVKRYTKVTQKLEVTPGGVLLQSAENIGAVSRRDTFVVANIGGNQVPVVIADFSKRLLFNMGI
jgi:(E)-4-hydroxy-3-methylbut-2-enyl-diphosphate synthase